MEQSLNQQKVSPLLVVAAFAAIYLIWGSTYFAILIAIKDIPPLLMAGGRFVMAGLLLLLYAKLKKEPTPSFHDIGKISFAGALMLFLGTGSVAWAEQYISSGMASIIVATVPLWFVLLDRQQWKFHFSNGWIIAGLVVGFVGIIILFGDKKAFSFSGNPMKLVSVLLLAGGTISWAIGSLYSKYKPVNASTSMKAAIQMLAAGVLSVLAAFITGEHHQFAWTQVSLNAWLALAYLITFGSLVGYMSYVWLLQIKPPTLVGTYAYVNPVVAVFLGWLIVDEHISGRQLIALGVILLGVIVVNLSKDKKPEAVAYKKREEILTATE